VLTPSSPTKGLTLPGGSQHAADFTILLLRLLLGVVFLAHGGNHIVGGKIAGTARWFESLGMRPGAVHAWAASVTELGAGLLLVLGLLTPLASSAGAGRN
jgi:putative oxidoreductase